MHRTKDIILGFKLAAGEPLTAGEVKGLAAWFDAHDADDDGWLLRGGDAGKAWVDSLHAADASVAPAKAIATKSVDDDALAGILRDVFAKQQTEVLGTIQGKTLGDYPAATWDTLTAGKSLHPTLIETKDDDDRDKPKPPPAFNLLVNLASWNERLAKAVTPIVTRIVRAAARVLSAKFKLPDAVWQVVDRNVPAAAESLALKFAESTNATTGLRINDALAKLRADIAEGIVAGDSPDEMAGRVKEVFTEASDSRAETIARTEAARARHTGENVTAKESGVVKLKKWLRSADACPICDAIAEKTGEGIPLDKAFGETNYGPIDVPPAHPNCACSITHVLNDEYEQ